jgi:hypothetical protein
MYSAIYSEKNRDQFFPIASATFPAAQLTRQALRLLATDAISTFSSFGTLIHKKGQLVAHPVGTPSCSRTKMLDNVLAIFI